MYYIGIDLAWGEKARTGVAELDPDGKLVRSASVVADSEIAAFVGAMGPGGVAAIDAPLIVPNVSGLRPCERDLGRLFGKYDAGAYPANRGNPAFVPEPRGGRLARRFGWDLDPDVRPAPTRSVAIEVYPHPAMVSLFRLSRVIPYKGKMGRSVPSRQAAFHVLFTAMEAACGPLELRESSRWQQLGSQVEGATRQVDLDTVEDEVDAIFCAYLAWMWVNDPCAMMVIGDHTAGYIVTPVPPRTEGDRHAFSIDANTGVVRFGDGVRGRRPASGTTVVASYGTGGGSIGVVTTPAEPSAATCPSAERDSLAPTGQCFCGCGQSIEPGRYFVATHDRKAEAKIIRQRYGSIAAFVIAHGYGPDHPEGGRQN